MIHGYYAPKINMPVSFDLLHDNMPNQILKSPSTATITNHQGWRERHYPNAILAGKSWSSTSGQQDVGGGIKVQRSTSGPSKMWYTRMMTNHCRQLVCNVIRTNNNQYQHQRFGTKNNLDIRHCLRTWYKHKNMSL
jgi:hypothetical protein